MKNSKCLFIPLMMFFVIACKHQRQDDKSIKENSIALPNELPTNDLSEFIGDYQEGTGVNFNLFQHYDTMRVSYHSGLRSSVGDTVPSMKYTSVVRWFELINLPVSYSLDTLVFVCEYLRILDTTIYWRETASNVFLVYRNKVVKSLSRSELTIENDDGFGVEFEVNISTKSISGRNLYIIYEITSPAAPPYDRSFSYFDFDSSGQYYPFIDSTHTVPYAQLERNEKNGSFYFSYSIDCIGIQVPVEFNFSDHIIQFDVREPIFETYNDTFKFKKGVIDLYSEPSTSASSLNKNIQQRKIFKISKIYNPHFHEGFSIESMWYYIFFENNEGWIKYSEEIADIRPCG